MKTCTTCGEEKPNDDFGKHSRNPDGKRAECKECCAVNRAAGTMESKETYGTKIIELLKDANRPMHIDEIRAYFKHAVRKTEITQQTGVSSALVNMRDRGEIRITGGGHQNSRKMIELIHQIAQPTNARLVRLTDTWKHDTKLIRNCFGMQSSMINLINMFGE